jgi:hypothetical protein
MGLPVLPLARGSFTIGDETIPIRSLSRDEALRVVNFEDIASAEVLVISAGTDVSEDEAIAWRKATDSGAVSALMDAVMELSGLIPKAGLDPKRTGNANSSKAS